MIGVIGDRCKASGGPVIYDITTTPPRPICPGCGATVMVCNGVAGLHKVPLPRQPTASLSDRLRRGARDMRRAADRLEAIDGEPLTIRVIPDDDAETVTLTVSASLAKRIAAEDGERLVGPEIHEAARKAVSERWPTWE